MVPFSILAFCKTEALSWDRHHAIKTCLKYSVNRVILIFHSIYWILSLYISQIEQWQGDSPAPLQFHGLPCWVQKIRIVCLSIKNWLIFFCFIVSSFSLFQLCFHKKKTTCLDCKPLWMEYPSRCATDSSAAETITITIKYNNILEI